MFEVVWVAIEKGTSFTVGDWRSKRTFGAEFVSQHGAFFGTQGTSSGGKEHPTNVEVDNLIGAHVGGDILYERCPKQREYFVRQYLIQQAIVIALSGSFDASSKGRVPQVLKYCPEIFNEPITHDPGTVHGASFCSCIASEIEDEHFKTGCTVFATARRRLLPVFQ